MSIRKLGIGGLATILWVAVMGVLALPALAAPEAPATREATAVGGTTATLHGLLNPGAKAAVPVEYDFSYAPSAAGNECTAGGALTSPDPAALVAGAPKEAELANLTELEGNTEYAFCLVANTPGEPAEVSYGVALPFKTLAIAPKVEGAPTTPTITASEATVEAQVNPENQASSSCVFEYGTTIAYGKSVPCAQPVLEGGAATTASATLTGLVGATPTTTYHFRVVVANASGSTKASEGTGEFTTLEAKKPAVEAGTNPPAVTPFEATIEANINPEEQPTTYLLEYSTSPTIVAGKLTGAVTVQGASTLSGTGAQAVSFATGAVLNPSTTYYFQVVAENERSKVEGKAATGAVESFKTLPAEKPSVEPESTSGLTPYEATLEAQVNPDYQETTYSFEYATNNTLTGAVTLKGASALTGGGAQTASVSTGPKSLTPGTKYYYRVVATNKTGTKQGKIEEFETSVLKAPEIEGESAPAVNPFGATLEGIVNPEYQASTCVFEYSTKSTLPATAETKTAPCSPEKLGEGFGGVGVSVTLTGLAKETVYYYRLSATNTTGTTKDPTIETFTTEAEKAPSIDFEGVSGVNAIEAKLEAQINPNYELTTYEFEYAPEKESTLLEGHGTTAAGARIAPGFGDHPASVVLANALTPGTTYYYRAVATNGAGTTTGQPAKVEKFTTPVAPSVTTGGSSAPTRTGVAVSGSVNPNGVETTYHFAYIEQAGYEAAFAQHTGFREIDPAFNPYAEGGSTSPVTLTTGSTPVATGAIPVGDLQPETTYDYALVVTNVQGTTIVGQNATFTTSPKTPPIATTGGVEGLTQTTATLTGTVDTRGLLPSSEYFEFGTAPYAGGPLQTATIPPTATGTVLPVYDTLSALSPGTTYYYRTIATNPDGTEYGAEQSFTTPGYPQVVLSQPPTPAFVPFQSIAELNAREAKEDKKLPNPTTTKTLTNAEKLKKALKECKKDKSKSKRATCVKQAKKHYGPAKKKKGK